MVNALIKIVFIVGYLLMTGCAAVKTADINRCQREHVTLKQYMNAHASDFIGDCAVIRG